MKQRLTMILIMLTLGMAYVLFSPQNISAQDTDGDGVPNSRDNCPVTPNPEKIAFVTDRNGNDPDLSEIYVMNADGTNQIRLTNDKAPNLNPSFSWDGSKIAFVSTPENNREIYVMNADGTNQIRLTNNTYPDISPSFSPDGSKIAFTIVHVGGNSEIYVMNADGTNQVRLTNNPAADNSPTFSPDGSKIAFTSQRNGNSEIYVMNADGTNQMRLTNHPAVDADPSFSHDGAKIAFHSTRDGNAEIYVMNADGTNQVRLTNNPAVDSDPSFSPDGTKIAFSSFRDGSIGEIYVMNADGTNPVNLTNHPRNDLGPSWGRQADSDGDGIGDACENNPNRNRFFNFSDLLRKSSSFIEVDAGSNVPVSFSLNGFMGFDIYEMPPASQQISCSDKTPLGPLQPIQTFPGDPTYNSVFNLYLTTWRTQAAWAGTCRRLVLTFNNGTTKTMDYRFR